MKKYPALILGVFLVLTLAESAFAVVAEIPAEPQAVTADKDTKITIQGEVMVRGWDTKNIGDTSKPAGNNEKSQSNSSPSGK